jgi:hypothetical protein
MPTPSLAHQLGLPVTIPAPWRQGLGMARVLLALLRRRATTHSGSVQARALSPNLGVVRVARFRHIARVAVISVGLTWAAAYSIAQPVAVVVEAGGAARLLSSAGSRPVETLELLQPGARLQLETAGRFAVLYLQSGVEFTFNGRGLIEVGTLQPVALEGDPPVRRLPTIGKEIRLRPDRVAQGGVVLRSLSPPPVASAAAQEPADIQSRRPDANEPMASWVAYALWLEDAGAGAEAKTIWRQLAVERPTEKAIAKRAR